MRAHQVLNRLSRLAPVLRYGSTTLHQTLQTNLRVARFPALSSLTATSLFLASDSRPDHSDSYQGIHLFQHPSKPLLSLRDVPSAITNAATDTYSTIRSTALRIVHTEGSTPVVVLTAVNVAVYLMWKAAPANFMVRHFANSLESVRKGRIWTSFTSNFSHMNVLHLVSNMYLLNRFGPDVASILGNERFYIFYATAGVASSLASLTFRRLTRSNVLSLGASGAVVSVLWLYACFFPDRRMSILGMEKTLSMQELVLAYTVIDAAGLLGSLGKIDFAAHLGGAVFGNSWFYLVRNKLVQEEEVRRRKRVSSFRDNFIRNDKTPRKQE